MTDKASSPSISTRIPEKSSRPGTPSTTGALALGALGVVFGDIGTSPLYAIRACFSSSYGLERTPEEILGLLSIIFWVLIFVVSFKYLFLIFRVDSRGEGGICSMLEKVRNERLSRRWRCFAFAITMLGAALLFGDGIITPAISVLSALEGLSSHSPEASRFVMPISVLILVILFGIQRFGTGKVGLLFGPIMLVWFISIGVLGAVAIVNEPLILRAVNPMYGFEFIQRHMATAFIVLGAIVLVVTGCESLYADMGHFGRRSIRLAWYLIVLPSLLLTYFGQGASLLSDPTAFENPFFSTVPDQVLWPMIILATISAMIASQAIITGLFSLTRQASNLQLLPSLKVIHTSSRQIGQIYVPAVNAMLGIACIILVVTFHDSDALAAAYGVAVTGMMALTTIMFMVVGRSALRWSLPLVLRIGLALLVVDLLFFSANVLKIPDGGWVPIAVAAGMVAIMGTWLRGTTILSRQHRLRPMSFSAFKRLWPSSGPLRSGGTGVFLTTSRIGMPAALTTLYRSLHVLPEKVVLLSIQIEEVPFIDLDSNIRIYRMPQNIDHVTVRRGYLDAIVAPLILEAAQAKGLEIDHDDLTYYVRQLVVDTTENRRMRRWRRRLFQFLLRNQWPAVWAFHLPPARTVAVGIVVRV